MEGWLIFPNYQFQNHTERSLTKEGFPEEPWWFAKWNMVGNHLLLRNHLFWILHNLSLNTLLAHTEQIFKRQEQSRTAMTLRVWVKDPLELYLNGQLHERVWSQFVLLDVIFPCVVHLQIVHVQTFRYFLEFLFGCYNSRFRFLSEIEFYGINRYDKTHNLHFFKVDFAQHELRSYEYMF